MSAHPPHAPSANLFKNRALLALACAAFGIGTTEFVIMGLLPEVAADLHVTIPGAGALISAYALGVTLGGPLMAMATTRLPRKATLIALMSIFTLGNVGCALSPDYHWLMAARILTALSHATFFGVGLVVGTSVVPANKRTLAVGLIMSGLTVANVVGVPLGTLLGQAAGWRSPFWAIAGIGVAAIAALAICIPSRETGGRSRLRDEFLALRNPQVWFAVGTSVLSSASMFALFSYIAPFLRDVTGIAPDRVGYILLLLGIGITAGNLVGSRLGDWKLMPSINGGFAALIAVLCLVAVFCGQAFAVVPILCAWGGVAFGICSMLQTRVITQAENGPNLASTLNQSAFNLGNASGAWLGGLAISAGVPLKDIPWLAAALAVSALALIACAAWRESKACAGEVELPSEPA